MLFKLLNFTIKCFWIEARLRILMPSLFIADPGRTESAWFHLFFIERFFHLQVFINLKLSLVLLIFVHSFWNLNYSGQRFFLKWWAVLIGVLLSFFYPFSFLFLVLMSLIQFLKYLLIPLWADVITLHILFSSVSHLFHQGHLMTARVHLMLVFKLLKQVGIAQTHFIN